MQVLKSNIKTDSEEFKQNERNFLELMAQYREAMAASMQGGGEAAVAKHKKRNKLLARERIDLLIDPNTPFLELSPMAAYGTYHDDFRRRASLPASVSSKAVRPSSWPTTQR
jgi:Acetyl-CoA carboxylase, carboxyltransferase component (subunits alpha and beta)